MIAVSFSSLDHARLHAYQVLMGKVMGEREGQYFATFGTTSDAATDPAGIQDKRQRAVEGAHADGFSMSTAQLSGRPFLRVRIEGSVTLSANPLFGLVQSYRASVSRWEHGLPPNASNRQSGRKRRRKLVKAFGQFSRLFSEA